MADTPELSGPDLEQGIPEGDLADGAMLGGHARGKPVLLARRGDEVFAVGAQCTHYGGPLAEGLFVGHTVRCPWHHACFDVRTGEATCAPALNPLARWTVARRGGKLVVTDEQEAPDGATPLGTPSAPEPTVRSIVVVGAGAAGEAAVEMLRRRGYDGALTFVGADPSDPVDRPNLSKDYLAGNAPEEWIPLRDEAFYAQHRIDLVRGRRATSVDAAARAVVLDDGRRLTYDRLLIATGAEPVRLSLPGGDLPHVHYLRTLADSRAIIAAAEKAKRVLVMGASFIGLEVAASLRTRGLEVHVVAPDARPLERVLGPEVGDWIRALHESHGVTFHLGRTATRVEPARVTLDDGATVDADLVVIGVGVRPALALAESAGAAIDKGVTVNEYLETSVPNVYAAGDIARFPDARTGERIRVEHWVVAERLGQAAARNMLGARERFADVPFFWSAHYDRVINYVGHAERWDAIEVNGDLAAGDATVAYRLGGRVLAVATVGRDRAALEADEAMARGDDAALEKAIR
jgi:NADPH-dependent 2,4-dienoyl-CoA reductase/sulfur reductase-like enzyme/nitrite reductase/ring-hydroxylating ferredoxin subunit